MSADVAETGETSGGENDRVVDVVKSEAAASLPAAEPTADVPKDEAVAESVGEDTSAVPDARPAESATPSGESETVAADEAVKTMPEEATTAVVSDAVEQKGADSEAKPDDDKATASSADSHAVPSPAVAAESLLKSVVAAAPPPVVYSVPRLDDLMVQALAQQYDKFPALDYVPRAYIEELVALIDPTKIKVEVAAKFIRAEPFWRRLSQLRWNPCKIAEHGLSWKRYYLERHLEECFEKYHPSKGDLNLDSLRTQVAACSPFVHTLRIKQLLSHVDVYELISEFSNLSTLDITYGTRKLGMDYDKKAFGLNDEDIVALARFISTTRTLISLRLTENLFTDRAVDIIAKALAKNDTITNLDLSRNKIGNAGAGALAAVLEAHPTIVDVNISDNCIADEGAKRIAGALAKTQTLRRLALKLNPLGDEGGEALLQAVRANKSVVWLDLSSAALKNRSHTALIEALKENSTLLHLDVSCNTIVRDDGAALVACIAKNSTLQSLVLKRVAVSEPNRQVITAALQKNAVAVKRIRRQRFFAGGWDGQL